GNPNLPLKGDAIQLGWEDEQVAIWLNRQADRIGSELTLDAPCGVAGYRVDVRAKGDAEWRSLLRVASLGDLTLGAFSLGSYEGEGVVETIAAQDAKAKHRNFWLPPYFAAWHGGSLALSDTTAAQLQSFAERLAPTADAGRL